MWKAWKTKPILSRRSVVRPASSSRARLVPATVTSPEVGGVEPRHDIEQGRLSRARFTADRDMLARFERQREPVEKPASAGKHLGERGHT